MRPTKHQISLRIRAVWLDSLLSARKKKNKKKKKKKKKKLTSFGYPLRKHAYSNIWNISPKKKKNETFQIKKKKKKKKKKNSNIFHISAQNIDCGYSLEPPRQKKEKIWYTCKPQFYYMKVGFKGVNII